MSEINQLPGEFLPLVMASVAFKLPFVGSGGPETRTAWEVGRIVEPRHAQTWKN
jgi:hypothetical protein